MCEYEEERVLVTIVTVVYNRVSSIQRVIDSIKAQTYKNIEYIVIDGNSTDGTLEVLQNNRTTIDILVSENDHGIYDAMNKGIKLAHGELIGFIGSDDWYSKDAVSNIVSGYINTKADVIYGDVTIVQNYNEIVNRMSMADVDLGMMPVSMQLAHQGVFVKTRLMQEYLFDVKYKIAADYHFLLRLYYDNKLFRYVNSNIAFFSIDGESFTHVVESATETRKIALDLLNKDKDLMIEKIEENYSFSCFVGNTEKLLAERGFLDIFRNHLGDGSFYIWGGGRYGKLCIETCKKSQIVIKGVIDSNPDNVIVGNDIKIYSPSEIEKDGKAGVIIATRRNENSILRQISGMNITFRKVLTFAEAITFAMNAYGFGKN